MIRLLPTLLLAALPAAADPLLRPEAPAMPLRPAANLIATPPEEVENRPKGRNAHNLNRRISNITTPTIAVYLPPEGVSSLRTGVVICPGGGYSTRSPPPASPPHPFSSKPAATASASPSKTPSSPPGPINFSLGCPACPDSASARIRGTP